MQKVGTVWLWMGLLGVSACSQQADTAAVARSTVTNNAVPIVAEAWTTPFTPTDNVDSPAAWVGPNQQQWLIATAKETHQLLVYDATTGATLQRVAAPGTALGQLQRPNGVFVIDDLLFVVERDNHRVQLFKLPDFTPLLQFGVEDLTKPYGIWVQRQGDAYSAWITDNYEQANGSVPPLSELTHRVRRYLVSDAGGVYHAELAASYGDTSVAGALRVVESIQGDIAHGRLMIAEEDESYANELKVYNLEGQFTGTTIGREWIKAQAEGIALNACADGSGYWIATQQSADRSVFHVFDRNDLHHVGAFSGKVVANTDGIWWQPAGGNPRFPAGVLYAVHDDQGVAAFDWRDIAKQLQLPESCVNE